MKKAKSANGEGDSFSFLITFNEDSDVESRAWEVAKYLAQTHGRRKHAIVALLNMIGDYVEKTGKEFNPDEFAASFMYNVANQPRGAYQEYEPIIPSDESAELVTTQTNTGASSESIAANFFDDMEDLDL